MSKIRVAFVFDERSVTMLEETEIEHVIDLPDGRVIVLPKLGGVIECFPTMHAADALNHALDLLSKDMHQVSSRPCETCKFVSNVIGKPFGCYAYQKRMP